MEYTPQINEELLEALVAKYKNIFETRFNRLQLNIYFTSNGQPPTPDEYRTTPKTKTVAGLFVKVGRDYRIGIRENLAVEGKLLAFFHEYGHATYRREASEAIDTEDALIRTETAALSKSLELADIEGLPQIAYLAVHNAHFATEDPIYRAALDNVKDDPLWLKYSEQP